MSLGVAVGGVISTTNEGPWVTTSFTPAAFDRLYLIVSANSANLASAVLTITDTQNNRWDRMHSGSVASAQCIVYQCRSTVIARSMTVSVSSNLTLGGLAATVIRVSGYGKFKQAKSFTASVATQPIPAVSFTAAPAAGSVILALHVTNATPNMAPPLGGFTEASDSGITSPNLGLQVSMLAGGGTQTVTWQGASPGTSYVCTAVEIEQATTAEMDHFFQYGADSTFQVGRIYQPYANPWNVINGAGQRPVCLFSPSNAWGASTDTLPAQLAAEETRYYGTCVVLINFRKRDTTTWPEPLQDMVSGALWFLANAATFLLDTTRVCASGISAGATNLAMLSMVANEAAVGASTLPIGFIKSVLWFFGHNRSRMVDPAYTALSLTRSIPGACSVGSPEYEVLDQSPCSAASFDWVSGDGGSLDTTAASIYNLFTPGWWASRYPSGQPKPVFRLWHGTADLSIPYFCTDNPQNVGTGHARDNGFYQDLVANGFTVDPPTLIVGAGHGGVQFQPSRVSGSTNGPAVDAAVQWLLNAAGIVDTPIVIPPTPDEADLNGRVYQAAEFSGLGYRDLFPNPLVDDAVAQADLRVTETQTDLLVQNSLYSDKAQALGIRGVSSTTSLAVGTGSKSFTLTAPATLNQGWYVAIPAGTTSTRMLVRLAADLDDSTAFTVTCDIAIGSGTFASWTILPLQGILRWGFSSRSATFTPNLADNKSIIECTGTFTVNGPLAATASAGYELALANVGVGTITFDPNGAELVNDAATLTIAPGEAVLLHCNGTKWWGSATVEAAHDLTGAEHVLSGLTAGHILKAASATTLAIAALLSAQLPTDEVRAIRSLRGSHA